MYVFYYYLEMLSTSWFKGIKKGERSHLCYLKYKHNYNYDLKEILLTKIEGGKHRVYQL